MRATYLSSECRECGRCGLIRCPKFVPNTVALVLAVCKHHEEVFDGGSVGLAAPEGILVLVKGDLTCTLTDDLKCQAVVNLADDLDATGTFWRRLTFHTAITRELR
jgi:hypothetical protein